MKYCKKCGVLYSDLLDVCPKCGVETEDPNALPPKEAPKSVRVRQWIGIIIGIPALIAVLYAAIAWMQAMR